MKYLISLKTVVNYVNSKTVDQTKYFSPLLFKPLMNILFTKNPLQISIIKTFSHSQLAVIISVKYLFLQ